MKTSNHFAFTFLMLSLVSAEVASADFVSYNVEVDTTALQGRRGNLDFQFNPGGSSAESAIATITSFRSTGGGVIQPSTLSGDAVGSLPDLLTIDNGTPYNDVYQSFDYGYRFSFVINIFGKAVDSPGGTVGSSFALSLYDVTGSTYLLTTDPNGSVLTINLNPDGTTSVFTYSQSTTNPVSVVNVTNSVSVAEPSSLLLILLPLCILLVHCRTIITKIC